MHIVKTSFTSKYGKTYKRTLIRESFREGGKVKKRTIANISNCSPEEIAAITLALKEKKNLASLGSIASIKTKQGISFGATLVTLEVAKRIGIDKSLGKGKEGKLALWQVLARVIDQGSCLSATRLARDEASDELLSFTEDFCEKDLYQNLVWLSENQRKIEKKLFSIRNKDKEVNLFLYDVTSSYFEGLQNELAEFGYNRDGKRGKKQIVVGLLCDDEGKPVATEVFTGNTDDTTTFFFQIKKVAEDFKCQKVTFVGDKGMIKSKQIEDLEKEYFHYITSITKEQIKTLIKKGTIQMELFDKTLTEVEIAEERKIEGKNKTKTIRYVLRRNPFRKEEIEINREEKEEKIKNLIEKQNTYLKEHKKAKEEVAQRKVAEKIATLKLNQWMEVKQKGRELWLEVDQEKRKEIATLDGCYVIKTDLDKRELDKEKVHERYKDLSQVEWAFRTQKTDFLHLRPIYKKLKETTKGHVLVVMLSYLIVQELKEAWKYMDIKVEEGIKKLRTFCTTIVKLKEKEEIKIPQPNKQISKLLKALDISLPKKLNPRKVKVDTRVKLIDGR